MEIKIGSDAHDQRFDRYLRKYYKHQSEISLADIYSWIRKWLIKVNWKKRDGEYRLLEGDVVIFKAASPGQKSPLITLLDKEDKRESIDIKSIKQFILYEDQNWIFWNKSAWIVVHPGNKHIEDLCLNDYLEQYVYATTNIDSKTFTPSFGFRLDKDTSGIIVGAKNYEALKYLNEAIRLRNTKKNYLTIVLGHFQWTLTIDEPLFRWFNKTHWRAQTFVNHEKGVESKTKAKAIAHSKDPYLGNITLAEVELFTGRMHQIRAHMSYKWLYILWDQLYGDENANKILKKQYNINRQLLHSYSYGFFDPFQKKDLFVKSPYPYDFSILFPDYAR